MMRLKGGQTYRTKDALLCARVLSGELFVYVLPYEKELSGKKLFLCTVSEGETVPFLDMQADGKQWNFQLAAMEEAQIELIKADETSLEEIRRGFARQAGGLLLEEASFQEEIIEKYNMAMVKEEAYVYASAQERVRSIEGCEALIRENLAGQGSGKKTGRFSRGKDLVYQAAAFLSGIQGLHLLPYEKLKERFPRGMDVFQIASASGVPARRIRLEPEWFKKNIGPFLGRRKKDRSPLVFFRKRGKYYFYDVQNQKTQKIGKIGTQEVELDAVMFYRPLGKDTVTVGNLFAFSLKEIPVGRWLAVLGLTVLGAFAVLLLPESYEYLMDVLLVSEEYGLILQFAAMVFLCMAGYFGLSFVKNFAVYGNLNQIQNSVMAAVYDRLMHLSEDEIRNYDSADLAQRAMKTAEAFREGVRELAGASVSLVFAVIFGIRILIYDWKIGLTVFLCLLFFGIAAFLLCMRHMRAEKEKQREEGQMNSLMFQFLCGIQKIRTDGMEDRALYEYLKKYTKMCRIQLRQSRDITWLEMLSRLYCGFVLLLLFIFYSGQISSGAVGQFVGILTVTELFSQSVADAVLSVVQADFILPVYDRSRPILEGLVETQEGSGCAGRLEGEIEVSNVSFSYSQEEGSVLNGLSFRIEPGEYIGIVGASGCGKSTLLQILLGFEKPDKGCVFYDHKNLEQLSKPQLRKKLGVVLQEESLFTGSIYENISASAPGMTQEQAWKLLEEVSLREEVEQMPMGLYTLVTEAGNTISGGQRQRILLARALAGNPSILFLDEATSALDNETQGKIRKMLDQKRMTRVVIAHRISTVKKCRRIFVLDHGKIAEEGTYDELLRQRGLFYELAKRQLFFC